MAHNQQAEQQLRKMTGNLIEKITPMLFAPVSMQQTATTRDRPAKGPIWVSRTMFKKPADQEHLKEVLMKAFNELAPTKGTVGEFSIEDVNVQWTSFKPSGQEKETEPRISEQEKYDGMMEDVAQTLSSSMLMADSTSQFNPTRDQVHC
jgi:hypothetical protein